MKTYELTLKAEPINNFFCQKAANSVDLNIEKKITHNLKVSADIETPFNIGLIIGSSGSGKTTLAKHIFGQDCFKELVNKDKCIIEQFPEQLTYDERVNFLNGSGLSQVPCWIKPVKTLSNGQQARAEIALQLAQNKDIILIDEFTSVVDRTIAKVMAHTVNKQIRRHNKKIILLSCHYDIIEWLNPDWIIDCNKQEYIERRNLVQQFERTEKLEFQIKECPSSAWKQFSKYHYLSEKLAGGFTFHYGLFYKNEQIGYINFAEYVPWGNKKKKRILHFNRVVIHPDYVGFGLGIKMINELSKILSAKYQIMGKFSSIPVMKALKKNKDWVLTNTNTNTNTNDSTMKRKSGFRQHVKWWSFLYRGNSI
jgi:ABC-type Mn2+/Zn2+ transport system ATPase subunit